MNLKPNKDKCIRDIKEHFFIFNKRCLSRFLRCVITNSNLHVRHWPNIQRLSRWINIFLPLSLPALMWVLSVPRPTSIDIKSSLISLKAVDCFIQARMFLESVPFRSFRSRQVFWCQFCQFQAENSQMLQWRWVFPLLWWHECNHQSIYWKTLFQSCFSSFNNHFPIKLTIITSGT